ncbi:hypothetical protein ILYODFUR_037849 [Ilyodon furcidens]|uniref:Uncharacterized protein n=1 Tax=Ilyodon furcidens TaxID=33524 RepID=A0ABV0UYI4_9TELE
MKQFQLPNGFDLNPMNLPPPMNSNINFPAGPLPQPGHRYQRHASKPKYHESLSPRGTPAQESSTLEKPMKTHPYSASTALTLSHRNPHHKVRCDGKARAPYNSTQASSCERNIADIINPRDPQWSPNPIP